MEKIGTVQFVSLLILFQIGSYVIFGFAGSAKQDAWLVALLSGGIGLGLAALYVGAEGAIGLLFFFSVRLPSLIVPFEKVFLLFES